MSSSVTRHGLCIALLTVTAGLGLGACGASDPAETIDEDATEKVTEGPYNPDCGHQGEPGASCLAKCCHTGYWVNIGNPGNGNCHEAVEGYCNNRGHNCGECWGWIY